LHGSFLNGKCLIVTAGWSYHWEGW